MNFIHFNVNPKGKRVSDCVVRAIARAENANLNDDYNKDIAWRYTFKALSDLSLSEYVMPNEKTLYEKYLEQHGWKKQKTLKKENGKKYTVKEFAEKNIYGTFLLRITGHLTVIVDGDLYDTWNCQNKCVGNFWHK